MLPSKHHCTVKEKERVLLYAILKGYKFIVGKIIENSIMSYHKGGYNGLIPHLALISRLCILGVCKETREKRRIAPRHRP